MNTTRESASVAETLQVAAEFSTRLQPGTRVGLVGELGAGKTVFAKGIISSLCGIAVEDIPSPTFTLIEEYANRIYHVDLYRLNSQEEGRELAWDELLSPEAVTLVEWPEKIAGLLNSCDFLIAMERTGPEGRRIQITGKNAR